MYSRVSTGDLIFADRVLTQHSPFILTMSMTRFIVWTDDDASRAFDSHSNIYVYIFIDTCVRRREKTTRVYLTQSGILCVVIVTTMRKLLIRFCRAQPTG